MAKVEEESLVPQHNLRFLQSNLMHTKLARLLLKYRTDTQMLQREHKSLKMRCLYLKCYFPISIIIEGSNTFNLEM